MNKPIKAWALTNKKSGRVMWVGMEKPEKESDYVWYFNGGVANGGTNVGFNAPVVLTRVLITPVKK